MNTLGFEILVDGYYASPMRKRFSSQFSEMMLQEKCIFKALFPHHSSITINLCRCGLDCGSGSFFCTDEVLALAAVMLRIDGGGVDGDCC